MAENKIKISFDYEDEDGDRFQAASSFVPYEDMGYSILDELGRTFNIFLKQAGYYRQNELLFMKDITEEEYDYLEKCLGEFRDKKRGD